MLKIDLTTKAHLHGTVVDPDFLVREIRGLKRLLAEAESNADRKSVV